MSEREKESRKDKIKAKKKFVGQGFLNNILVLSMCVCVKCFKYVISVCVFYIESVKAFVIRY